jgi:tetratricopeptide (TPR) repeat protein
MGAEDILNDLRVNSSDYFEFHRIDAFVARKAGDIPRAIDAYEAALEVAKKQPQLHVFYAGLLSRDMADFTGAMEHLERALEIDPGVPYVLQEAARNAFFAYDFPRAKEYLERASVYLAKTRRDATIFADLTSQLHYREADYLARSGDLEGAARALGELSKHLEVTPIRLFDDKHLEHVRKNYRLIMELRRSDTGELTQVLDELSERLRSVENQAARGHTGNGDQVPPVEDLGAHIGRLREPGRTSSFGFLRNRNGDDCYVSRASVGERVWARLCAGASATYEVIIGPVGKPQAINISVD